ncbi:MAG: phospho-sugar mutase [Lachnospiraceae bacterium]|nr:phospho-sugar mutase [Lachnospiraceae bacterium]
MDTRERYVYWRDSEIFDEKTRAEVAALEGDDKEIEDRFYKDLEFGTGGLRGVIGAGTNRMNIYTVGRATQGLADYIIKNHGESKGVAIAYDSRHMSVEFSEAAALVLCANGIKAYRFESLRPTPELSFAVRELGCIAGIVVTASHNPPEYNGYKVYWEDGAQVTPPHDVGIISQVNSITDFSLIKTMDRKEAESRGLFVTIGEDIDSRYMACLKKLVLSPEAIAAEGKNLKAVYTPLHGTGNIPARRVLKEIGFEHIEVVPEQEKPDGDFPTVGYPNPEDPNVYKLALEQAKKIDADLILATDPDADRLGVYAKDSRTGEYKSFTGNMSGLLLCEYQLARKKEKGLLPANAAVVKTIVSTNMTDAVAADYGCKLFQVLTGFKYIGEKIKEFEQTGEYEYEFGFEESYGCLIGTHARDKDAIVAVMALCEAAAYYKTKGITLWDRMIELYEKYGYFKEGAVSLTFKGIEGANKIKSILEGLRGRQITTIGSFDVKTVSDYSTGITTDPKTGKTSPTGLPKSNVLYYDLSDDAWCCVRPSGTEPKIKFYFGVKGKSMEDADRLLEELSDAMMKLKDE